MSTVFIINPETGEIVEELTAFASYRSPKGVTVKPRTPMEEQRLRAISENAVRIRKLKEEIQKLDASIAQYDIQNQLEQFQSARARRKRMTEEIQRKENFAETVHTIHRLQSRTAELETIEILLPGEDGEEMVSLNLDTYTAKALSGAQSRLEKLNQEFQSDDSLLVKKAMQELVALEEEVEALPELARKTYIRTQIRLELAQNVIDRLAGAGWAVTLEAEGDAAAPTRLTATNPLGDRAAVIFACDDQIHLETPGFAESARGALQQLVLGTLRESGAEKARGRCMDHQPPEPRREAKASSRERDEKKEYDRL